MRRPHGQSTILIVDRDRSVRLVLTRALEFLAADYQLESTPSAHRALDLAAAQHIALLIADYEVQEMDGPSLVRAVREHAPHTRIIGTTAFGLDATALAMRAAGADAILAKPFRMGPFIAFVRQALAGPAGAAQIDDPMYEDTPTRVKLP